MSRPPVFTSRCCKLVNDHFPIGPGQCQSLPQITGVVGDDTQSEPHLVGAEAMQLSRVILIACLPSLIHRSAVPRLL